MYWRPLETLTPQQLKQLPTTRERWRELATRRTPIEPEVAEQVVFNLYRELGRSKPEVVILSTPQALAKMYLDWMLHLTEPGAIYTIEKYWLQLPELNELADSLETLVPRILEILVEPHNKALGPSLFPVLEQKIQKPLLEKHGKQCHSDVKFELITRFQDLGLITLSAQQLHELAAQTLLKLCYRIPDSFKSAKAQSMMCTLATYISKNPDNYRVKAACKVMSEGCFIKEAFLPAALAMQTAQLDFSIQTLNFATRPYYWRIWQDLFHYSHWMYCWERVCLICDRGDPMSSSEPS
ncbi:MAG: hypothetical protein AAGG02_20245 [Cyanobacteria bacterium P01_H01_bin.15]